MSRPGRPRSTQAREAILRAAAELLIADGYEALSIAGISERAGVGRQTIYRWWRSKAGIIAEAAVEGLIAMPATAPISGPGHTLHAWIDAYAAAMSSAENQSLVRALTAAAAEGDSDSSLLYRTLTQPTQRHLTELILAASADTANSPDSADITGTADPASPADSGRTSDSAARDSTAGRAKAKAEAEASVFADAIIGTVLVRVITRTPVSAAELSVLVRDPRGETPLTS